MLPTLLSGKQMRTVMTAVVCFLLAGFVSAVSADDLFPLYPCIRNNVMFWRHVYETFSSNQGIVHDQEDLSIIYGIIPLVDRDVPGAAESNRQAMRRAKRRYRDILRKLADGRPPANRRELMVAALFPTAGPGTYRRAMENIRVQTGQKDSFIAGFVRSGAYIDEIKRIFVSYGLPEQLAYLPHVESSFNHRARSRSGAVGTWQFILSTGREFMTINQQVDERYDPLLSSHAAARFLRQNYEKLGTWPLAITAYHHGQNGMIRALRAKGDFENIVREYRSKGFGFASRNYYAEFLAALQVAGNLERDPSVKRDSPLTPLTVSFPGTWWVRDLFRFVPVSGETLARLNPALRSAVLEGGKPLPEDYPIRLPDTPAVRRALELETAGVTTVSSDGSHRYYLVRPGDTAGRIARRFQVPLELLIRINDLDESAAIFSGRRLRIPVITPVSVRDQVVLLNSQGKRSPDG